MPLILIGKLLRIKKSSIKIRSEAYKYADQNSSDGDNIFGNLQSDKLIELTINGCAKVIHNRIKYERDYLDTWDN